jgi:hypothetical protein
MPLIDDQTQKKFKEDMQTFRAILKASTCRSLSNLNSLDTLMPKRVKIISESDSLNDRNRFILCLIRDKTHQAYQSFSKEIWPQYELAKLLISQNRSNNLYGSDAQLVDLFVGIHEELVLETKKFVALINDLPGMSQFISNKSSMNMNKLIKDNMFITYTLKRHKLALGNESYTLLPNGLHYSMKWAHKIMGRELTSYHNQISKKLQEIQINDVELALLIALCIVLSCSINASDSVEYQKLLDTYKNALMNEFNLNKRDSEFYAKISHVSYFLIFFLNF